MSSLTWIYDGQSQQLRFGDTQAEIKEFLEYLTNLNEKSATIGAGKLANIKEQAQYLLDKSNKE